MTGVYTKIKNIIQKEKENCCQSNKMNAKNDIVELKPQMKIFIVAERQFICITDLLEQSIEILNSHLKRCPTLTDLPYFVTNEKISRKC